MENLSSRIELFVPGRLCLFGEHSDWAGLHRTLNSNIIEGSAIVTGIEQGIYASISKSENFIVTSEVIGYENESLCSEMSFKELKSVAYHGGYFSYVAGVASYVKEHYKVGGLDIKITKVTLPIKKGLSSSAAICVLVARAFNILYNLQLSTLGEMNIAYRGEQRTPSRCGRLDQACAFGAKPVSLIFDGNEIEVERLKVNKEFYWVFADLMAQKDTIKILSDLNKCYPFPQNEMEQNVHDALGKDNRIIIQKAIKYMEKGDDKALGELMIEAQDLFDEKVAPACLEQLKSPILHKVLNDEIVKSLTYGRKGVGSQGDGTVQFLAKDKICQDKLMEYLNTSLKMDAYSFTISPQRTIKKAIIPVAGFGTRLYPATRAIKKEFLPVIDKDGLAKPVILILLEELINAGIEEICIVTGEEDIKLYEKFFKETLLEDHINKLPKELIAYESKIRTIGDKLTFIIQKERLGFGHAVYQCKEFAQKEPVLLLLGDTLYSSNTVHSCSKQLIDAYEKFGKPMISIQPIDLASVGNYGVVTGVWENANENFLDISDIIEKPSSDYAENYLKVISNNSEEKYFAVFGQYILTSDVFDALEKNILEGKMEKGEFQLTDALNKVSKEFGMEAFVPEGKSYDIGIPLAYKNTIMEYGN